MANLGSTEAPIAALPSILRAGQQGVICVVSTCRQNGDRLYAVCAVSTPGVPTPDPHDSQLILRELGAEWGPRELLRAEVQLLHAACTGGHHAFFASLAAPSEGVFRLLAADAAPGPAITHASSTTPFAFSREDVNGLLGLLDTGTAAVELSGPQVLALFCNAVAATPSEDVDANAMLANAAALVSGVTPHLQAAGMTPSAKKLCREDAVVVPTKEYLGVVLDTVKKEYRMSPAKIAAVQAGVARLRSLRYAQWKVLASVVGTLSFCSLQAPAARTYLRRLYNALRTPSPWVKITHGMREDLAWWAERWERSFNGRPMWRDPQWRAQDDFAFFTDACKPDPLGMSQDSGFGGIFGSEYFYGGWADTGVDVSSLSINTLETVTMLLAIHTWTARLAGRTTYLRGDNSTNIAVFENGSAKHAGLAELSRRYFGYMFDHDMSLHSLHFPGEWNVLADLLSRDRVPEFLTNYSRMMFHRFGPAREVQVDMEWLAALLTQLVSLQAAAAEENAALTALRATCSARSNNGRHASRGSLPAPPFRA